MSKLARTDKLLRTINPQKLGFEDFIVMYYCFVRYTYVIFIDLQENCFAFNYFYKFLGGSRERFLVD